MAERGRRRLVLATRNAGKLRELSGLLAPAGVDLLSLADFDAPPVEEAAPTFVENALLKARSAAEASGLPALADDSGLEVDALAGAPGVRSARYAGEGASDAANVARLLAALEHAEPGARGARFRCVMTLLRHPADPAPIIGEGVWQGAIALAPRGREGFGYDPVFEDVELGRTAAELSAEEKNARSHRARAVAALIARLGEWRP